MESLKCSIDSTGGLMAKVDRGGERCTSIVITKPAVLTDLLHGQSFPRFCGKKSYRKIEI